jgi:hypothetical protein
VKISSEHQVDAVPPDASRRKVLRGAVVFAAAAGAAALHADRADAANGAALVIGSTSNTCTSPTGLTVTGSAATYGFGITDNGLGFPLATRPAMWAHAQGTNFNCAFEVLTQGPADGLHVVCSGSGQAVYANSDGTKPTVEVLHVDGGGPAIAAQASFGGAALRATGTAGSRAITAIFDPVDGGAAVVVYVQQKGSVAEAMHVEVLPASSAAAAIVASATKGAGVIAKSGSGTGVNGQGKVGGSFTGTSAQVRLNKSTAATHPASGTVGDLFVDTSGRLWFCKGTTNWKQLA